jgi:hypothetical protein
MPPPSKLVSRIKTKYLRENLLIFIKKWMVEMSNSLTPLGWFFMKKSCCSTTHFLIFCGTQSFITMFTRALHWSLSWARSIQSIPPHPMSHLSFWLSHQNPICIPVLPHSCYMPWQLILIDLIILIILGKEYKLWSFSLWSFLQPHVTSYSLQHPVLKHTKSIFLP